MEDSGENNIKKEAGGGEAMSIKVKDQSGGEVGAAAYLASNCGYGSQQGTAWEVARQHGSEGAAIQRWTGQENSRSELRGAIATRRWAGGDAVAAGARLRGNLPA